MSLTAAFDALAAQTRLDGRLTRRQREAKLDRLTLQARAATEGRLPCPECDDTGPHDDNGERRLTELSYCCRKCGCHFDAEPAFELLAEEP
jgi:hypothetical protein